MSKPNRTPFYRHKRYAALIGVGFLVVAAFVTSIIWRYENNKAVVADRARFEQEDKIIKATVDKVISSIGMPISTHRSTWCSRPNLEWENSPLSCNLESIIFYDVPREQNATDIYKKVITLANPRWVYKTTTTSQNGATSEGFTALSQKDYKKLTDYQLIDTHYFDSTSKIDCDVTNLLYKASDPPFEEYISGEATQNFLAVTVSCQDDAKAAYFKLK